MPNPRQPQHTHVTPAPVQEERDAATQARSEQSRLKAALVESQARAAGLEAELEQAKAANTGLQAQVCVCVCVEGGRGGYIYDGGWLYIPAQTEPSQTGGAQAGGHVKMGDGRV